MVCKYREWSRHKYYAETSFQMVTINANQCSDGSDKGYIAFTDTIYNDVTRAVCIAPASSGKCIGSLPVLAGENMPK